MSWRRTSGLSVSLVLRILIPRPISPLISPFPIVLHAPPPLPSSALLIQLLPLMEDGVTDQERRALKPKRNCPSARHRRRCSREQGVRCDSEQNDLPCPSPSFLTSTLQTLKRRQSLKSPRRPVPPPPATVHTWPLRSLNSGASLVRPSVRRPQRPPRHRAARLSITHQTLGYNNHVYCSDGGGGGAAGNGST